jgi:hypothetical protein
VEVEGKERRPSISGTAWTKQIAVHRSCWLQRSDNTLPTERNSGSFDLEQN